MSKPRFLPHQERGLWTFGKTELQPAKQDKAPFDIASFGPANTLESEQKDAALIKAFPSDCEAAQNRIAMGAMGEAVLYVHKCCRGRIPPSEIVSLCYKTLMYAARQVDAEKGRISVYEPRKGRFFAYSKPYLRSAACSWWRQQDVVKGSATRMEELYHDVAPISLLEIVFNEENPLPDPLEYESQVTSDNFNEIALGDLVNRVRGVVDSVLNTEEKELLRLYYQEDKTLTEVGQSLTKPVSKEVARLRRNAILAKLRKALRKQGVTTAEKHLS